MSKEPDESDGSETSGDENNDDTTATSTSVFLCTPIDYLPPPPPTDQSADSDTAALSGSTTPVLSAKGKRPKKQRRKTDVVDIAKPVDEDGKDDPPTPVVAPPPKAGKPPLDEKKTESEGKSKASAGSIQLRFGARHITLLFAPVTITMLLSLAIHQIVYMEQNLVQKHNPYFLDITPFSSESGSKLFGYQSTGTAVGDAVADACVFLALIIVMTTFVVILYVFRFYKTLGVMMGVMMSFGVYMMTGNLMIARVFRALNVTLWNWPIMALWGVNFGVGGPLAVFWKAPPRVTQGSICLGTAIVAVSLTIMLPKWPCWIILGFLALWDIFAVCAPCGPLRIMVTKAQERQNEGHQFGKGMLYETMVWLMADVVAAASPGSKPHWDAEAPVSHPPKPRRRKKKQRTKKQKEIDNKVALFKLELEKVKAVETRRWRRRKKTATVPAEAEETVSARSSESDLDSPHGAKSMKSFLERAGDSSPAGAAGDPLRPTAADSSGGEEEEEGEELLDEATSAKLGLGDFVFYSILLAKCSGLGREVNDDPTADVDWPSTICALVSILVGLCATLVYLSIRQKPLPALPISILTGLAVTFVSYFTTRPFALLLSLFQAFP